MILCSFFNLTVTAFIPDIFRYCNIVRPFIGESVCGKKQDIVSNIPFVKPQVLSVQLSFSGVVLWFNFDMDINTKSSEKWRMKKEKVERI